MNVSLFTDRFHAGQLLADRLAKYSQDPSIIVLGLPRGGVPVAYQIAIRLKVPLDVFLVRKLGVPGHEELAMGAIAAGGICIFNDSIVNSFDIPQEVIEAVKATEQAELMRRMTLYRNDKPPLDVTDKKVILVDDGLATGATMKAAVKALKLMQPRRIIIAVPVAAFDTYKEFQPLVDEIVCLALPTLFYGVGMWYKDFAQTSDQEVIALLATIDSS